MLEVVTVFPGLRGDGIPCSSLIAAKSLSQLWEVVRFTVGIGDGSCAGVVAIGSICGEKSGAEKGNVMVGENGGRVAICSLIKYGCGF